MRMILDAGYWSYDRAYVKRQKWETDCFKLVDQLYHSEAELIIALDSHTSFRRMALPNYKANRTKYKDDLSVALSKDAHDLVDELIDRYGDKTITIDGLEADDVIALSATDDDWLLVKDKDFLTLKVDCTLSHLNWTQWGIEKLKHDGFNLTRGERAFTYQLLYGDVADNIPRLLETYDRNTGPWIFEQERPLQTVIDIFPEALVRDNLNALFLPTPLMYEDRDPIDVVLEYYYGI